MGKNIEGKIVVITGGSSGIGEATARHLAALGASVVLGARRTDKLEAIVKDITAAGGKAKAFATDVTKKADVDALIAGAISSFGKIDVLVNNAGIMALAPLALVKTEEWDRMIDVNIKGLLYGVAAALPVFQKQGSGHFINLSSVAGGVKVFSPAGTVYSGTKAAVSSISEGLRHEVGGAIRTTTIEPGVVASELVTSGTSDIPAILPIVGPLLFGARAAEFTKLAIPADSIARAIAFAIEQPADVDINEIVVRPTVQDF
jgi:NADP-dependent 3-hydroxy acid dehydrogenase YdfG